MLHIYTRDLEIMTTELWTFLGIVVGCGAFWEFIKFLLNRRDERRKAKQDKSDEIAKTMDSVKNTIQELSEVISTIQASVNKNNADMDLQSEALMAIAQDRILSLARVFIKQGWIYADDLSNIQRIANSYRALGGNDLVKTEMEIIDTLEVRIR